MIKTWKSYKKRIMYKKGIRHFSKYERSGKRFIWAQFMFQISMDERREFWLNDYKKFYSSRPLRDFNLVRKRKGWVLISPSERRKARENAAYWGKH